MIREIVVKDSHYRSDEDWVVVDALSQFARHAGEAGYSWDQVPQELLWNSQVTNAFVQISRNGPSLYFFNVLAPIDGTLKWETLVQATRTGLRASGNDPQLEAYDKLIALYEHHHDAILEGRKSGEYFKLENDLELFSEFLPSSEADNEFMKRRVMWVRSLDMIRVVADDDYEQALASVFEAARR